MNVRYFSRAPTTPYVLRRVRRWKSYCNTSTLFNQLFCFVQKIKYFLLFRRILCRKKSTKYSWCFCTLFYLNNDWMIFFSTNTLFLNVPIACYRVETMQKDWNNFEIGRYYQYTYVSIQTKGNISTTSNSYWLIESASKFFIFVLTYRFI